MAIVKPARASEVAAFLGVPLRGDDLVVNRVQSAAAAGEGALTFLQSFTEALAERLNRVGRVFVLADSSCEGRLACPHVIVADPRLAYARVAQHFFEPRPAPGIAPTAQVHPGARLGARISVGPYAVIEDDVEIGEDSVIGPHVVIHARTRIGRHAVILAHAVIGKPGFGFDFDQKIPVWVPQLGSVRIGDHVQIGCGTTISCATMDETVIEDHVKIDDLVFVAHNCRIGRGTIITPGAIINGRTQIAPFSWIGANATIREGGVRIGEGAVVGLAAAAMVSVQPRQVVMGNPARVLRTRREDEEF